MTDEFLVHAIAKGQFPLSTLTHIILLLLLRLSTYDGFRLLLPALSTITIPSSAVDEIPEACGRHES